MGQLVAAFGSSHSVMLAARREDWIAGFRESDRRMPLFDTSGEPRDYEELLAKAPLDAETRVTPERMREAYARALNVMADLKRRIDTVALDALIIVGDDQHELFQDAMMPALGIYYGETIRNAARGKHQADNWYARAQSQRLEPEREAHYPVHSGLALHLIAHLTEAEFDVCALKELRPDQYEGHAYSNIHRIYLAGRNLPIVPILLNTYYPPNPVPPKRCVRLGRELQQAIRSFPPNLRIGLLASGGLSHFVVDEELDLGVIEALRKNDLDYLSGLDPKRLQAGSSEIRSWIVAAAASSAAGLKLEWVEYIPAYRTPALTGIGLGFARWL
jgi:catalytic LigB subunit of aromatic ring-opening dioxygenase